MNTLVIDLLGFMMLLMWGLRMMQTGVSRAFGVRLRYALALSTQNRAYAFVTGLVVTLALQSSTATSLMATSFASRALVTTSMAMAVMLGANVGTALAAKILSLDVHWLSSVSILAGGTMFMASGKGRLKAIGRTLVGLGLMLLALRLIGTASEPMHRSDIVKTFLAMLDQVPLVGFFITLFLTMATVSSLPVLFLIASLAIFG